jgi:hypothetical protein
VKYETFLAALHLRSGEKVTNYSARPAVDNIPAPHRPSTKSENPSRAARTVEVVEPLCRVCRDPDVRRLVNALLDWRGVPIPYEGGKTRRITYSTILGWLEPINEGRPKGDRITYDSLWIHARRHYDLAGIAAYWGARMDKELRNALGHKGA